MPLMDNLALHASSQKLVLGFTANPRTDGTISNKPLFFSFKIPKRSGAIYKSSSFISTPRAINKSNEAESQDDMELLKDPYKSGTLQNGQQVQDMLNNMGESSEFDRRVEALSEKMGHIPEVDISKLEADPDLVMACQNPRVRVAMLDCVENSMSIIKYENDKEVMDVLTKIFEFSMLVNPELDNRLMYLFKEFELGRPEVREQFEAEVGLTPEEFISKICANPVIAMLFDNPKVQAAFMDLFINPKRIIKYLNDKEVMHVLIKLSELLPGVTGAH